VTTVHVVVPDGLDDPARPSGGNVYDRRICDGLVAAGWQVIEYAAAGSWPSPEPAAVDALARLVAGIADRAVVLIDGLIASTVPEVLVPEASRLHLVVLVHMPLEDPRERAVLSAAQLLITTSPWTRARLVERYELSPEKVWVAEPGVDAAELAPGTESGGELLCVAAVTWHKGHDLLLAALANSTDLPWRCACVGTLEREPAFVERLRLDAKAAGIADRICFSGPLVGEDLARAYAGADVLVLASRAETYAMVVTEALARGLPVIATAVGGLPEALGQTGDGRRPGLLVPAEDSPALAAALREWLVDAGLRQRLRDAACDRRSTLAGWDAPTGRVARILTQAAA
jgi:glycosyltransferase involved in cell wall biosynthesis